MIEKQRDFLIGSNKNQTLWFIGEIKEDKTVEVLKYGPYLSENRAKAALKKKLEENRI